MNQLNLSGWVAVWVQEGGIWILKRSGPNLVVVDGFQLAAELITGTGTPVSHMAAGDDGAPPEEEDSTLGNELDRVSVTTARDGHVIEHVADFSGISQDIQVSEFGLFNASSGGTMFARWVEDTFTLFSGQSMEVSWEIRVGT